LTENTTMQTKAQYAGPIEIASRPRRYRISPDALAGEAADALGMDQQEGKALMDTSCLLGRWMCDHKIPEKWDRLDLPAIVAQARFRSLHQREEFLFSLTTLLGYASVSGHLSPVAGRRYMEDIQRLASNPATVNFAVASADQLAQMIC
jgi:hypothetical protein